MSRIARTFALVFSLILSIFFLVLGPTIVIGISANLLGVPDFIGALFVIAAFTASVVTALSNEHITFWERRADNLV